MKKCEDISKKFIELTSKKEEIHRKISISDKDRIVVAADLDHVNGKIAGKINSDKEIVQKYYQTKEDKKIDIDRIDAILNHKTDELRKLDTNERILLENPSRYEKRRTGSVNWTKWDCVYEKGDEFLEDGVVVEKDRHVQLRHESKNPKKGEYKATFVGGWGEDFHCSVKIFTEKRLANKDLIELLNKEILNLKKERDELNSGIKSMEKTIEDYKEGKMKSEALETKKSCLEKKLVELKKSFEEKNEQLDKIDSEIGKNNSDFQFLVKVLYYLNPKCTPFMESEQMKIFRERAPQTIKSNLSSMESMDNEFNAIRYKDNKNYKIEILTATFGGKGWFSRGEYVYPSDSNDGSRHNKNFNEFISRLNGKTTSEEIKVHKDILGNPCVSHPKTLEILYRCVANVYGMQKKTTTVNRIIKKEGETVILDCSGVSDEEVMSSISKPQ